MFRDITLGQFYQTDSVIHRLDPRVKLLGTILFFVSLFCFNNPVGYAVALLFLAVVIIISNVPFKYIVKGLRSIAFILLITVVINLFAVTGEPVVSFWKFTITKEGIVQAVYLIFKLGMLIIGSSIVTLTTTPNNLTDGLEKGLGFLKIFKVPVHEVAMMMSIALRFIPILLEETDKIMKAQLARGADFESGNVFKRVKAYVPILVPLFVSAFRRANDLAMAMEARCYRGGDTRTKMKPLKYSGRDAVAYVILFVYTAGSIVVGRLPIFSIDTFMAMFSSM
ncbi:MAG: energy-coupling factor transporter transmembrane protein EcfT [Lachnospiraceae bacterium]|nr:energy-coupling factor transporter transmembrane protein EcfT [Lachnospiraceae bacterium]